MGVKMGVKMDDRKAFVRLNSHERSELTPSYNSTFNSILKEIAISYLVSIATSYLVSIAISYLVSFRRIIIHPHKKPRDV